MKEKPNLLRYLKGLLVNTCYLGALLTSSPSVAKTFTTTSMDVVRTPGVGFQASIAHPPTLAELNSCNFDDNDVHLEEAGLKSGSRYVRLMWQDFEPEDDDFGEGANDAYGINMLRRILDYSHAEGKAVDLRIQLAWPKFPTNKNASRNFPVGEQHSLGLPNWLLAKPNLYAHWSEVGSPGFPYYVADWSNTVLWNEHAELIQKLGNEFDGHRALNAIDIGSVGFFGEWHYDLGPGLQMPVNPGDPDPRPSIQRQQDIVDLYYASFPSTPKIALEEPFYRATAYSPVQSEPANYIKNQANVGWRGDSWGGVAKDENGYVVDRGYFNNRYNDQHVGLIADIWKTGQISTEISGNSLGLWEPGSSTAGNFDYLWNSINKAVAWHVTNINSKLGPIPQNQGFRNDLSYLAKKLGFRLVLWSAEQASNTVAAGESLNVSMTWENKGIAPPYRDFRVAFRLKDASNSIVDFSSTISDLSVKGWLPGPAFYNSATYNVPAGIAPGNYTLEMGLVFHNALDTVLPIVVDQRNTDFWVPLDTNGVTVTSGSTPKSGFSRIISGTSDTANQGSSSYNPDTWRIIDDLEVTGNWNNGGDEENAFVSLYLDQPRKVTSVQYYDNHARRISVGVFDANDDWVHGIEEVVTQPGLNIINFPSQASSGGEVIGTRVSVWSHLDFGYVNANGQLWLAPYEIDVFGWPQ